MNHRQTPYSARTVAAVDDRNDFQRRIGVGEPSRSFLRHQGTSRTTNVIREEGRTRGSVGGSHTEHWDGRVDATVRPETKHFTKSRSTGEIKEKS